MHRLLAVSVALAAGCGGTSGSAVDGGDASRDGRIDSRVLDGSQRDAGPDDGSAPPDGPRAMEPPPPPEWNPSFELGEPGWRESTEPFCSPYAGLPRFAGVDLWADHRGVFVVQTIDNSGIPTAPPYPSGTTVQHNDGSGWKSWLDLPASPGSGGAFMLNGIRGGPVWMWPGACPLRRVDDVDETACVYSDDSSIVRAHMLTETSGWLLLRSGPVWLDEEGAAVVGAIEADERAEWIWGDMDEAIVVTSRRVYRASREAGMTLLRMAESDDDFTTLWARSVTDFWVATESGALLELDGGEWTTMADAGGHVSELWSDGDWLYFAGSHRFGRWSETDGVEVILGGEDYTPTASLRAMTGDEESGEVYLAFFDGDFVDFACGPAMIVWFDGEELHRF